MVLGASIAGTQQEPAKQVHCQPWPNRKLWPLGNACTGGSVSSKPSRFQSFILLPFARRVMIWVTGLAFLVAVGAFIVGGFLYARSAYVPGPEDPDPIEINTQRLFSSDSNAPEIRVEYPRLSRQGLFGGTTIAYITSANALDPIESARISSTGDVPNYTIEQVGTADEEDRALQSFGPIYAVMISDAKADAVRNSPSGSKLEPFVTAVFRRQDGKKEASVLLQIDLRDSKGSSPRPGSARSPALPAAEAAEEASDVTLAAQVIALLVDPERGPLFFRAYDEAIALVRACTPNADIYAATLRRELEAGKPKLSRQTVIRFVNNVCALWRTEEARFMKQRAQNIAAAEAAAAEALVSRASALIALYVAGSALVSFIMFAMMLAVLAIENHTLTLRVKSAASDDRTSA